MQELLRNPNPCPETKGSKNSKLCSQEPTKEEFRHADELVTCETVLFYTEVCLSDN